MNTLTALIVLAAALAAAVLAVYRLKSRQAAKGANAFIAGFGIVLLALSVGVYASLGRWGDWQTQKVDEDIDYLLAARITEARRNVEMAPQDYAARRSLALVSLEAGRYEEAVAALDEAIRLGGEQADLLGLKAFGMYYRDGRTINPETRAVIDRALARNPYEVQTRMLLGEDAFFRGQYPEAIQEWRLLLESGAAPGREKALKNAIANAKDRMARKLN